MQSRRGHATAVVLGAASLGAPVAQAQAQVEQPALVGYQFCGWRNFAGPGWTLGSPEDGVYLAAFARGLTCKTARRHVLRATSKGAPLGYCCVTLKQSHEYLDRRCTKRATTRAFRFQTGA